MHIEKKANKITRDMVKILIVEDDPLLSRMYREIFSSAEYKVEVALDGQEGIDKAKSFEPDIILLDIMMPKMDGLTALDILKKDTKLKSIPVVMLTNIADSDSTDKALSKGAVKYIVKSEYDPNQVIEMVSSVLAKPSKN